MSKEAGGGVDLRTGLVTFALHDVKTYGGDYNNHKKITAYYHKCVFHPILLLWRLGGGLSGQSQHYCQHDTKP